MDGHRPMSADAHRDSRGIGQSWAGVAEGWEPPDVVLGANSGPPSEQYVLYILEHLSSPGRHFQAFVVKLDLYQRAFVQEFKNSTPISFFSNSPFKTRANRLKQNTQPCDSGKELDWRKKKQMLRPSHHCFHGYYGKTTCLTLLLPLGQGFSTFLILWPFNRVPHCGDP